MKFFGLLLIFVLLFITNFRVFFVSSPKRDPLVAVAPFTFLLSILQVFAWGVDLFTVLGVLISFLVLLSNFHAMFRYSERLYVDHYSNLMRVWAVFTNILSFGAIVLLFIFVPVELNSSKLNVTEKKIAYNGDFTGGFYEASPFDKKSAFFYEYTLGGTDSEVFKSNDLAGFTNKIVLFVPDKRGDTAHYKPFLQLLAAEGYTVCSCDFFARDGRWFYSIFDSKLLRCTSLITESILDNQKFNSQREFYTYNISLECKALLSMLKERYGSKCKIFVVTDSMGKTAVSDFALNNKDIISGVFSLDSVKEYESAGYGCIAQTAPIVNTVLHLPKDRKFKIPKILVERTKEAISF